MVRFGLANSVFVGSVKVEVGKPSLVDQPTTAPKLIQMGQAVGRIITGDNFNFAVLALGHQPDHKLRDLLAHAKTLSHEETFRRQGNSEDFFRHSACLTFSPFTCDLSPSLGYWLTKTIRLPRGSRAKGMGRRSARASVILA